MVCSLVNSLVQLVVCWLSLDLLPAVTSLYMFFFLFRFVKKDSHTLFTRKAGTWRKFGGTTRYIGKSLVGPNGSPTTAEVRVIREGFEALRISHNQNPGRWRLVRDRTPARNSGRRFFVFPDTGSTIKTPSFDCDSQDAFDQQEATILRWGFMGEPAWRPEDAELLVRFAFVSSFEKLSRHASRCLAL